MSEANGGWQGICELDVEHHGFCEGGNDTSDDVVFSERQLAVYEQDIWLWLVELLTAEHEQPFHGDEHWHGPTSHIGLSTHAGNESNWNDNEISGDEANDG